MSDLWAGSSDIFTDYEGTITDAKFEANEYGTQMVLTFDDIDGRENGTKEFYAVDKNWESQDGGDTITRIDGQLSKEGGPKPMRRDSQWQRFLMAAADCNGAREALGDDAPITAGVWIGTRWHMMAIEGKSYKDRDTGEMKKGRDKNYPDAFLGKDSVSQSPSNGSGSVSSNNLSVLTAVDPLLGSQISDLAKTLSYNDWFQQSFKLVQGAGVPINDGPGADLVTAMGTRQLYESLGGRG